MLKKFHLPTELMWAASSSTDWCVFRYKLNLFSEQKKAVMHILILFSSHFGLAHQVIYPSLAYGKHPFTSFFPILD